MNWFDRLRPWISRVVLAPLAVVAANKVASATGVQIDSQQLQVAADLAIYGLAHRAFDKAINPADTASAHLATSGKEEATAMKQGN